MGGQPAGQVERTEHDYALWEKRVDALLVLLSHKDSHHMTVDELRRNIEGLGSQAYDTLSYYERWMHSIAQARGNALSILPAQASAAARQRIGRNRFPPANKL